VLRGSFRTIAILAAIPIAGLAAFFVWQWINGVQTPPTSPVERRTSARQPVVEKSGVLKPAVPREEPLPKVRRRRGSGSIVLIIDDLGFDGQPLERLMKLDPNVNYSILPNGTRTREFAEALHARGFEILCHLPMEPKGRETPGRNAILTSMSDDEIARATRENIDAVPYARGVNNHMGSLATADRRVMRNVIAAIPDGMYFIDSRTTGGSVAADVASEMKVPNATRHVFLDDVATERSIRRQLDALADAAQKRGIAVGIGHPYPVTLRVLADELPELKARGFTLRRASEAVK
jgi:polysaccharide deacetylase 2 family uncharacterized protein YibQ